MRKKKKKKERRDGVHGGALLPSTGAKLQDKHARVAKIPKAFKLLDRPLIPPHQKYTKSKPVGHNNKVHVLGARLRPLEASHIYVRS